MQRSYIVGWDFRTDIKNVTWRAYRVYLSYHQARRQGSSQDLLLQEQPEEFVLVQRGGMVCCYALYLKVVSSRRGIFEYGDAPVRQIQVPSGH